MTRSLVLDVTFTVTGFWQPSWLIKSGHLPLAPSINFVMFFAAFWLLRGSLRSSSGVRVRRYKATVQRSLNCLFQHVFSRFALLMEFSSSENELWLVVDNKWILICKIFKWDFTKQKKRRWRRNFYSFDVHEIFSLGHAHGEQRRGAVKRAP